MHFIRMVPKLPLDIAVPQYALRRRGAICVSVISHDIYKVSALFYNRLVNYICILCIYPIWIVKFFVGRNIVILSYTYCLYSYV